MRVVAALAVASVLAGALARAEQAAPPEPALEGPSGEAPPPGRTRFFLWRLWWERGVRYTLDFGLPTPLVPDADVLRDRLERPFVIAGKIGGRLAVDGSGYGVTGDLPSVDGDADVRRFRLGTNGEIARLRGLRYWVDFELNGDRIDLGDVYVALPDLPWLGTLTVGNYDPPFSLEALVSSRDTVFMEKALPVAAFAPGRKFGVQLSGCTFSERLSWGVGAFSNLRSADVGDRSRSGARVIGRLAWRLEDDPDAGRLTQVGGSASVLVAADELRYASRPESYLAPQLVDTGTLAVQRAPTWSLEVATVRGRWLAQAEYLGSHIADADAGTVHGAYVLVSRFLTADAFTYNRRIGVPGRVEPARPLSWRARRFGAVAAAARLSWLDLERGVVDGGRELDATVGLTWYLNRYLLVKAEYVLGWVSGRPADGTIHAVQTRFQVDVY